jgi:heme oxygenase
MSLKDLTAAKHAEAESTPFMKAVFEKTLPFDLWVDFTYQKTLFYNTIEGCAGALGLLSDLPDVRRAFYLNEDYKEMTSGVSSQHFYSDVNVAYHQYILSIAKDPVRIMAHLYTWHMGDLFGGQMIKKIVEAPHRALDFKDAKTLMTNMRSKLDDAMGDEANVAFDWAIKLMREYDSRLE